MSRTEELIKAPIEKLVHERFASVSLVREYPLGIQGRPRRFLADFAFRLPEGGWVFIEDDDAARALHNVAKYWMWMEDQDVSGVVHLVHLIGPGARELPRFMGELVERANPRFRHHVVEVERWEDEAWQDDLATIIERVMVAGGDGEPARGSIRDEPFVGMWKDREDMRDSTVWVRELRRQQWTRR